MFEFIKLFVMPRNVQNKTETVTDLVDKDVLKLLNVLHDHCYTKEVVQTPIKINLFNPNGYNIILLSGKAGCGKDTVGELFKKYTNCHVESFAEPLKHMAAILVGPRFWDIYNDPKAKNLPLTFGQFKGKTIRQILQQLGTDSIRDNPFFTENIWRDHLAYRIMGKGPGTYVITDCRFDNEVYLPNKLRGILPKGTSVKSTVIEIFGRAANISTASHSSESGLSCKRWSLNNSKSLEDLEKKIKQLTENPEILFGTKGDI
jgi:hypothetical protein